MLKLTILAGIVVLLYLYINLSRRVKALETYYKDLKLDKKIAETKEV